MEPRRGDKLPLISWRDLFRRLAGLDAVGVVFALVTVFMALTTAAWVSRHAAPPEWDPAVYLRFSLASFKALAHFDLAAFARSYVASMWGIKAPLVTLLPFPGYFLFGTSFHIALYSFVPLWAVFNYAFYYLVWRLTSLRSVTLLAVVVADTMPLMFGLSRQYFVEFPLAVLVVVWLAWWWHAVRCSRWRCVVGVGVLSGLGLLLKVTFPIYVALPAVVMAWQSRRSSTWLMGRGFAVLFLAIAIASTWYGPNFSTAMDFAFSTSYGTIASDFSLGPVFSPSTIVAYWLQVLHQGISGYYGLIGVITLLFWLPRFSSVRTSRPHGRAMMVLVAWIAAPLLVFTFGVNKEIRYILPALPALAALLALLLDDVAGKKFGVFSVAVGMLGVAAYVGVSFWPRLFPPALPVSALDWRAQRYSFAPDPTRWPIPELHALLESDRQRRGVAAPVTALVLASTPAFNLYTLNYYAELASPRHIEYLEILSQDEQYANQLLQAAAYVIVKSGDDVGSTAFNPFGVALREKIRHDDSLFTFMAELFLPDGSVAAVYRRR